MVKAGNFGSRIINLRQQLLAINRAQVFFDHVRIAEKSVQVKQKTFVDAIVRSSAVEHSVTDQKKITFAGRIGLVVRMGSEGALQHVNDLPLLVPVKGHVISGMGFIHVIVSEGEIRGAM